MIPPSVPTTTGPGGVVIREGQRLAGETPRPGQVVAINYGDGQVDIAQNGTIIETLLGDREDEAADSILSRDGWTATEDWGPETDVGGGETGREAEIEREQQSPVCDPTPTAGC